MCVIKVSPLIMRPWAESDKASLIRYANGRARWLNTTDLFPFPYTAADAATWLAKCAAHEGKTINFAIEFENEAIGGIGFQPGAHEHSKTAEIGYWLGEPFWGKGFATLALIATTSYAFTGFDLERMEARVFEWNPASARVLEKAGFMLEARLRRSIIKEGRVGDELLYARLP